MKASMQSKLEQLSKRYHEINHLLSNPDILSNLNQFKKLNQEQSELSPLIEQYQIWCDAEKNYLDAKEMLADPTLKLFAEEEISASQNTMADIEKKLQLMLLPKDDNDERNIFIEIRAGTGGDESALFAGDLLRMYLRYAERQNWQTEIISENAAVLGGYKEIIIRIMGKEVYSHLKFESGGHRVQRVPTTETQGRIHTSACTIAVLPEADAVGETIINPAEIRIDTFRASGAGGQHINKTDSAVRITHLPTGLVVECQDDRSQHRNKERALTVLAARIKDKQTAELQAKEAAQRRTLIGSGDRSERIRTYNFPQGRMTDHRVNLTLYRLDAIMDGDLTEMITILRNEHQADQLAALSENN